MRTMGSFDGPLYISMPGIPWVIIVGLPLQSPLRTVLVRMSSDGYSHLSIHTITPAVFGNEFAKIFPTLYIEL